MKTDYIKIADKVKSELKDVLTPKRLKHTLNVAEESVCLAEKYGADKDKARFIALAHDRFRDSDDKRLSGNIAHGRAAAEYYEKKYGITDNDVLNSIRYHTTGRKGMGLQEKIIFLADAIEKGRDYPGVNDVRSESKKGLNYGVRASLINTINYLKSTDQEIDSKTTDALKYIDEQIDMETVKGKEE